MLVFSGILGVLALLAATVWWRRRSRVGAGLRCWNCGHDLSHGRIHVDFRNHERCPKCGDPVDEGTRSYRIPRS